MFRNRREKKRATPAGGGGLPRPRRGGASDVNPAKVPLCLLYIMNGIVTHMCMVTEIKLFRTDRSMYEYKQDSTNRTQSVRSLESKTECRERESSLYCTGQYTS